MSLTNTKKKDRSHKQAVIDDIRSAIDAHSSVYLFSYSNMRSNHFKKVRLDFKDGRIFLGKNKLMAIALGRSPEDEYMINLKVLGKKCSGSVGLLMTDAPESDVVSYFSNLSEEDFARSGSTASTTVQLTAAQVENHPVSMVDQFRKLNLPVQVKNGKVTLVGGEFTVCKAGDELSADQCKVLVHFGIKMSEFKVDLEARLCDEEVTEY